MAPRRISSFGYSFQPVCEKSFDDERYRDGERKRALGNDR